MKRIIEVDENLICEGFVRNFTEKEKDVLIKAIGNSTPYEEQPTGEWVFDSDNIMFGNPYGSYKCTNCNSWTGWVTHFCSNCGAKMKGEQNE